MSLEAKLDAAAACLRAIAAEHPDVVLANSYGAEDMVLTDLIARLGLPIAAFSLDTGRLPAETYDLMQRVEERYPSHPVTVYFPQAAAVEHYVKLHGINGFYQSVDQRKSCCQVRKLEPLRRALAGRSAWINTAARAITDASGPAGQRLRRRQWPAEVQPAAGLERARCLGLPARARGALQRSARPSLSLHWLRALYSGDLGGRGCPRRALVVGKP